MGESFNGTTRHTAPRGTDGCAYHRSSQWNAEFQQAFLNVKSRRMSIWIDENLRVPPNANPPRNKAFVKGLLITMSLNTPLIRPYFLGGVALLGGTRTLKFR